MWLPVPAAVTNPAVTHECGCGRVQGGRSTRVATRGYPYTDF